MKYEDFWSFSAMDFQTVLAYYQKNGLYQKQDYVDKIKHLAWFNNKHITIEVIHDYCTLRILENVKNATINREINVVRAAFNYWNRHHDTKIKNPFNGFNLFEEDFIPRFLDENECRSLLTSALDYQCELLHAFIYLCLNTGCRAGELLKLEWENVYLDNGFMIVRNTLSKNRKTVYKPLNANSIQKLKEIKHHDKWVFYNPRTDNRRKTFRRGFLFARERAKLDDLRIHDLRHTFASFLVKEGVPLYHVCQLLGHSDIRVTQRYAHLAPDNLHHVLDKLPDF